MGGELALNSVKGIKKIYIDDNEVSFEKEDIKRYVVRNNEMQPLTKVNASYYDYYIYDYPEEYTFNVPISALKLRPVDPTYVINDNTICAHFYYDSYDEQKILTLTQNDDYFTYFNVKNNTFIGTDDTLGLLNADLEVNDGDFPQGYTLVELNGDELNIIETEVIYTPIKPFYFPNDYFGIGILKLILNHEATIPTSAFSSTNIVSFEMNQGVKIIKDSAFEDCTGLTTITIPDSVTTIDKYTFNNCSGLTTVILGKNLTSIGNWAFGFCTSLNTIKCYATTAPAIQNTTFASVKTNGKLYYPSGSATSYKNTWLQSGNYYLGSSNWTGQTL